ncbi:hypothetical protein VPH35_027221 [Triticum aestivum]
MGSGSKAASRKSTASSSSWRSLLDGCLGWTMAAGENVPASGGLAEQPPPIVRNNDLSLAASNSNLHAFTFAELCAATEGFACCNQIGSGEFGTAYRGFIEDGVRPGLPAQPVAVKRTRWRVDNCVEGMVKEAMFLGELQLRHPCLVRMIDRLLLRGGAQAPRLRAHGPWQLGRLLLQAFLPSRAAMVNQTKHRLSYGERAGVPPRRGEAIDLRRIQCLRHPTGLG